MDKAIMKDIPERRLTLNTSKNYSKSKMENKDRIRFAEYYDVDWPKIDPKFMKHCKCAGILAVDDQFINRFIIKQYSEKI